MILVGGENLIDFVQTDAPDGAALYQAIPGGSCYNCAIATARQGQDVTYMTPVSEDALGAMLAARLAQDNIALAAQRVSQPTSLAVVSLADGIPSYQFYREGTAERQISYQQLIETCPAKATAFHIGSLALVTGSDAQTWEAFFKSCAEKGMMTCLDPNARPGLIANKAEYVERVLRLLGSATLVKLSDEDLAYLLPELPLLEAFEKISALSNAALLVLTMGQEGAIGATAQHKITVPARVASPLADTVGAGDTFMGTLIAQITKNGWDTHKALSSLRSENVQNLLEIAATAAALNCERAGCNPPYLEELYL
jgi:fructokinase